ncbi:MAG: hypothetical protein RSD35_08055 [Oscillospiraceae bacterium]
MWLTGCAYSMTIEEMLTAPALTADQSEVLKTLNDYTDEKTVLKYPASGDRRAPIQFVDIDSDGMSEAVLFFSVPTEDVYAMLAVMKKTDGKWQIVSVLKGPGTDVESISVIRLQDSIGRFLLVEWSNTNSRDNQLAAYHFDDNKITQGFEDACSDILVYDLDGDSFKEFCYITAGNAYEPFKLKYVDNTSGALALTGECVLNSEMLSGINIAAGVLSDGRQAVFVDENIGGDMQTTEVFTIVDGAFEPVVLSDGYRLNDIAERSINALSCRAIFGGYRIYIPSEQQPFADIKQPHKWTYWYSIKDREIVYAGTTYIDSAYQIAISIPDSWLSTVSITNNISGEPRMIEMYDSATDSIKLRLKILEIGDESDLYINNGFVLITQSGSYRYYVQANCPPEELNFIKNNFAIM